MLPIFVLGLTLILAGCQSQPTTPSTSTPTPIHGEVEVKGSSSGQLVEGAVPGTLPLGGASSRRIKTH